LAECEELYSELSGVMDDEKITLVDENRVEYPAGILVLPVYLAKGLEFDAVVLPEVNDVVYAEEFQRRLLYVACSRALHALRLLYTGNVSPLLAEVPESLFTWEEGAE
jgi:DNA helicase-2/ATP-dependent DNA helicase PcrA